MRDESFKIFRKNIAPSCACCLYSGEAGENATISCTKGKVFKDTCGAFKYEPTMREPKILPPLGDFNPEDFKI